MLITFAKFCKREKTALLFSPNLALKGKRLLSKERDKDSEIMILKI